MSVPGLRVGVDFDGTVALFDRVLHRCAAEAFGMPRTVPAAKPRIREWFWATEAGRTRWIELQGLAYGRHAADAEPAPGVGRFLVQCRQRGVRAFVISHKTERPVRGPEVDLHEAARRWLLQTGLVSPETGLAFDHVFFERTREDKLKRIAGLGCTHFVDDLPEVLLEPAFPAQVERWLYAPHGATPPPQGLSAFSSWDEIGRALAGERRGVRLA